MKKIGEIESEVIFGGKLPQRKPKELSNILDMAWKVVELLESISYKELSETIDKMKESENPNLGYIELLQNIRTYKDILNGVE